MSVVQAVSLVLLVGAAQAHDWGWGICPRVDPVQNLSVDKFMGMWYVIEQFDTSSSCLTLNYTRVSDTQLKVTKARQFYLIDAVGIEHTNSYTGTLDIPDGDNQGKMRVKWPLNLAGKGDYVVIDTDYTGYAGIYECQRITSLAHRQSATILSRTPTLDQTFVDRIKRRLKSFDIDDHDFDKIVHEDCISRSDSDLNINVDENSFKKVISGTVEGVKDVANTTKHTINGGYEKSKAVFSYGLTKTGQAVSGGLHKVADGVRSVADTVGEAVGGASGILAGQTAGDMEVVVVNVGNDENLVANPDAEFI